MAKGKKQHHGTVLKIDVLKEWLEWIKTRRKK